MCEIFGIKSDDSDNEFMGHNISSYYYLGRMRQIGFGKP